MTLDLRSVPVKVVVNGLDLSPAFISLSLSTNVWDDSGWFKPRGQLELAAFYDGQPESFDCRANPSRWAPGNVVAISVDLGAGWVALPWRLRILSYPNRPYPGQPSITVELGTDADLLNYRTPEGDPGVDEYGTPTSAKSLIDRALSQAGAPALAVGDTIATLSLPFSPEKNTGGSWMTYAGQVAYAARHILWQQTDGTIRTMLFDLDALTAPVATYTVGTNEVDYIPDAPGEQPPEVVRVHGTTYEISSAIPQDTDVTENIGGVITRTQVDYRDWTTTTPDVIETISIPLELMVLGKYVGNTTLYPYKKTTTTKTYDAANRLVEEYTKVEMPEFTVPFAPETTNLMTVGETLVEYEFPSIFNPDPDILLALMTGQVMTRKITTERALYDINGTLTLQDRVVTTETWEEKGPELYLYRINTRDDSSDPLKAPSRNGPAQFQGPPATTFKPAEKQRTEVAYSGEVQFQTLAGGGYADKLWSLQLPSGMGVSTAQATALATLWGRIRQGRQFPIKWAADLSAAWLAAAPICRVDFSLNGTTTAYLVEGFNLVIDQRSAAVGGRGIELGTVSGGVITPPYTIL